jgi:polyhomeotic-like protein 1
MANIQQQNAAAQQQQLQQQQFQQHIAQQLQLQQQQQAQAQALFQNQLMAAQNGNIQQVVLQQHPNQLPTVTVGTVPISQANAVKQAQVMTSQTIPTSIAPTQNTTSVAGQMTSDTSNSILAPLTSPQIPIQPPQNPLVAMKTLSASPMSNIGQKEKADVGTESIARSSPVKRPAEESKTNESKKTAVEEKKEESVSTTSPTKTPAASPSTTNSSTKPPAVSSPLALQNGEAESKKATNGNLSMLKNEVPKAMVKPNVLTHVIEGFVIQESNEPFPVTRQRYSEKENDEPAKKKQATEENKVESAKVNGESSGTSTPNVSSSTSTPLPTDMVACEQCGKQEMRSKLKKKRFCSMACARSRKSTSTDGSPSTAVSNSNSISNGTTEEKIQVPSSPAPSEKLKTDIENGDLPPIEEHIMMKWSVTQVCDFIKNLPGCSDYAEDFRLQEIDGQALLLLKENHLVSAMNMKLGPALKIVNKIESMRVSQDGDNPTETPPEQQ